MLKEYYILSMPFTLVETIILIAVEVRKSNNLCHTFYYQSFSHDFANKSFFVVSKWAILNLIS